MSTHRTRPAPCPTEVVVGSATVAELRGELDVVAALRLSARLDALTAGPSPDLVLDLRGVSFIDCSGLGLLCRARNRVLARRGRLRLVSDSAAFRRILRYALLSGVFEVHPDLPAALSAGSDGDPAVTAVA
ncbi:STAS domain-containing protein [Streptomyces sp. S.PB5]|uniref:STAS domain-containing protein n=1 Tax=Streptomyces sp. S.PB5 TaxID=3020844 RepID=UPI0025AFA506|nr:STAS domain-containing protein [Streptomyces sp. S.PB5]MDN3029277.1 STAS domain-containing protein [Streptomyces sp. S.PB5]